MKIIEQLKSALGRTAETLTTLARTQEKQTQVLEQHTETLGRHDALLSAHDKKIAALMEKFDDPVNDEIESKDFNPMRARAYEVTKRILIEAEIDPNQFDITIVRAKDYKGSPIVCYATQLQAQSVKLRRWLRARHIEPDVSSNLYEYHTGVCLRDLRRVLRTRMKDRLPTEEREARIAFLTQHIRAGTNLNETQFVVKSNGDALNINAQRKATLTEIKRWLHMRGLELRWFQFEGRWTLTLRMQDTLRILTEQPIEKVTLNRDTVTLDRVALERELQALVPKYTTSDVRRTIKSLEVK